MLREAARNRRWGWRNLPVAWLIILVAFALLVWAVILMTNAPHVSQPTPYPTMEFR
jgi:hypothetical protein